MDSAAHADPAARPAIYVASLLDYNNGILHGAWIPVGASADALLLEILAMLSISPTTRRTGEPAEEWAIHDYEGFGDRRLDPHESLEDMAATALALADTCSNSVRR
jgi:antirestriction protein